MALTRQDRINLHKKKDGIGTGEGTLDNLTEGVPAFRTEVDYKTGEYKTVQYIKNGLDVVKSEFRNVNAAKSSYTGRWHLSKEVDISSTGGTGNTDVLVIPANTYVMDVRILVTSAITAGSMDINVGIGTNTDVFIDGWDGTSGSTTVDTINAFVS